MISLVKTVKTKQIFADFLVSDSLNVSLLETMMRHGWKGCSYLIWKPLNLLNPLYYTTKFTYYLYGKKNKTKVLLVNSKPVLLMYL